MTQFCPRCKRYRPCPGSGPRPTRVMLIGEGPGPEEDARRIPFIGKSGRELTHQFLPMAGLTRDEVYITNAIKCRQGKDGGDKPDPADVLACARHHLPGELRAVQPDYIVTLGAVALRLFGEHSLELEHGRPLGAQNLFGWSGPVFCAYHPAAGLRDSDFLISTQQDFRNLWLWRHGKLQIPVDEYPAPAYELISDADRLWSILPQSTLGLEIAIDTETVKDPDTGEDLIWCLTFSMTPGTGYMILASDADLIAVFRRWLDTHRPLVVYHNYLYDGPILSQVGIYTPRFLDTMIEAYNLGGLVPQGLKALAYRLCGMRMQDYEDVVLPYALEEAVAYLQLAEGTILQSHIEAHPWRQKARSCSGGKAYGGKHPSAQVVFREPEPQDCWVCSKPLTAPVMVREKYGRQYPWDRAGKILTDTLDKGANPLKRWGAVPGEERAVLEGVIGLMPRPSIAQVPIAEAIVYACRDADATLRVKPALRRLAYATARAVRRAA